MQCLRCGKELPAGLGLCEHCLAERKTRPSAPPTFAEPSSLTGSPLFLPSAIGCAALLFGVLYMGGVFGVPAETKFSSSASKLVMTQGDEKMEIALGASRRADGRLISWDRQPGELGMFGIALNIGILSSSDYQVFHERYEDGRSCPAGFLNSNVQMYWLTPDTAGGFSNLAIDEWKQGDVVEIVGTSMDAARAYRGERAANVSMHVQGTMLRADMIRVGGRVVYSRPPTGMQAESIAQ